MSDDFARFMEHFWWHTACPQPDGRFNRWLGGKPYTWTARLHMPWYLMLHPERRRRSHLGENGVVLLSLLLVPLALLIWTGRRHHTFFRSTCPACNHVGPIPSQP